MPVLRKLLMLAVTTGVAKKAWDTYRGQATEAAGRPFARDRRRGTTERRTASDSGKSWSGRPGAG